VAVERAASTGFRTRVVDALDEIAPINIASPLCNESSSGCSSADSFLVFRKRGKLSQANAQMPQTRSRIGLGQPMPAPVNLRALLAQGKCAFSLGRVPEAVTLIEAQPRLFPPPQISFYRPPQAELYLRRSSWSYLSVLKRFLSQHARARSELR
jgi:hypothetical protein